MTRRITEEWVIFCLAVQFLTRLPLARDGDWTADRMASTPRWYGVVGGIVGAISGIVYWGAALVLPPLLAALLAVAAAVIVTGALHEDGFADFCDALGGSAEPDRALEIMRDSRIGTYGALGLGILVAIKIASLASLPTALVPAVLISGHALSRATMVVAVAKERYVRHEGLGKSVAAGPFDVGVACATALAAFALLAVLSAESRIVLGLVGLTVGHLVIRRIFQRRLGGYTGDCLGALQQSSETAFYLCLVVALG